FPLDFELQTEFWLPKLEKQGANSGIYLHGRHEVQILDETGYKNLKPEQRCGALYGLIAPKPGVANPTEVWQTFHITYRSPRKSGDKIIPGRITVVHNGVTVIDDAAFSTIASGGWENKDIGAPGPIMLQAHGGGVRFRKLKLRPLQPLSASG